MAHTYLLFDFGTDEEKAQLARHKLENWKQAFRLDKKLLYKLERDEEEANGSADAPALKAAEASKPEKSKSKAKAKSKSSKSEAAEKNPTPNAKVNLLVRLYFSAHERLTEQRMLDRIPSEEPFKDASPQVVRQGQPKFEDLVKQFESME